MKTESKMEAGTYLFVAIGILFVHTQGIMAAEKTEKSKTDMKIGLAVGFLTLAITIVGVCVLIKCCCVIKPKPNETEMNEYYNKSQIQTIEGR